GRTTWVTSAPWSARTRTQVGPARAWHRSRTLMWASGPTPDLAPFVLVIVPVSSSRRGSLPPPEPRAGEAGALGQRAQLRPDDLGVDPGPADRGAEPAVGPGD